MGVNCSEPGGYDLHGISNGHACTLTAVIDC